MTDLVAKTILENQFWIVKDGDKKVGNIEANTSGYGVQLNGKTLNFDKTEDIQKAIGIRFETVKTSGNQEYTRYYSDYPTPKRFYNSLFDVQRNLHLFTKTKKSKCLHAAGWFVINQNGVPQIQFCPKYIFIQRYPYKGPFKSEDEAKAQ